MAGQHSGVKVMFMSNSSKKNTLLFFLAFFAITYIVYYLTREHDSTPYNNFVLLADAFLNGRLYLIEDRPWLELVHIGGRHFVVPPPMPSILMLPAVAVWGLSTNQTLVSIFFGSLNVSLAFLVARALCRSTKVQIWTTVMFGFGTIHWWVSSTGGVWTISQTIAITFMFAAILLTFYRRHPMLIGLSIGASYWSRLTTALSLPFFIIYTYDRWYRKADTKNILKRLNLPYLILMGTGIAIFILLNALYNYGRFGTPLDVSYYRIPEIFKEHWYQKGIFDITYIPRHLKVFLFGLPRFIDTFPYIVPSWNGLAIWITTPAFIYAFKSGIRNKLTLGCWVSVILIAFINFCHGTWGFTQFGYRFAVDFYPFLFILTVVGIGEKIKWNHMLLILIGVGVNLWGVLSVGKFIAY